MLTAAEIAALVPHAGAMCLLGGVRDWNATSIRCTATSQADPGHPLRRDGMLPVLCGLEYALQAMALHGALAGGGKPQRAGYLSSLRGVTLGADRLDHLPLLVIEAEALTMESRGFIYRFRLGAEAETPVLSGQAAIILPEPA